MDRIILLIVRFYRKVKRLALETCQTYTIRLYLKRRNVSFIPQQFIIHGRLHISVDKQSRVTIGEGFVSWGGEYRCIDNRRFSKIVVKRGAELLIGNYSGMSNSSIICSRSIKIGNYVKIGAGCIIEDFGNCDHEKIRGDSEGITIGDHVFLGTKSIICKNVSIGDKSIIAAGSVVCNNVPQGEIWGGNPARFIKKIDLY